MSTDSGIDDLSAELELEKGKMVKLLGTDIQSLELAMIVNDRPEFKSMLGSIDPQGHKLWRLEREIKEGNLFAHFLYKLSAEKLALLLESLKTKTALSEIMDLGESSNTECGECGDYVSLETNGLSVRATSFCACPPEGPIEFELNVPSGEFVYTDDLRPLFDILGDYNTNTRFGIIKQSLAMAKIGCAHGFVGNSCPGVYHVNDRTFVIADVPTNDEGEPVNSPGESVGSICTDLWWYSFVDADEFKRRGGSKKHPVLRLKVRPGVYRFSHNLRSDDDYDKTFIYATVTWVRDPDPVTDYLKEFRESDFTAGQVIAYRLKKWPTLHEGEDSIMEAANNLFCVSGTDDWHPNGFVQNDPDMSKDIPSVEIPEFDKPFNWYPLSEYSAIVAAAGLSKKEKKINLNPSFAALARNVLECMVKYGSIPPNIKSWKEKGDPNLKLAKRCLKKINELYPKD